jgi:hypothetical protein
MPNKQSMLKALLIKLRKKPKVIREQVALVVAGAFTFLVLGIWAFSLPGNFSDVSGQQTAGFFSTLRDGVGELTPDLQPVLSELSEEAVPQPSAEVDEVVSIPNEYPSENQPVVATSTQPIRIATTSSSVATSTENNQ